MMGADKIINKHFAAGDRLGHILVKTESILEAPKLPELERVVFTYLDAILKLALLNPNSKTKDINGYKPGQETLSVLETIALQINNLYIRAFFLDILQVNKRNKFVHAKLAIQTYWLICESRETLSDKRDYYIRVLRILVGLGKGRKQTAEFYFGSIKNAVLAADMSKDCYSVTKLTEEMIPIQEEPNQYLLLINKIKAAVQSFLASREYKHYRECNHVLALLLPDDSVLYGTEVARSYILDVDDWGSRTNALQYMVAEGYKKGLRVFQNLGIKNQETESYRQKLVVILKKAAVHLLLPQIENGLKVLLESHDKITHKITEEIQTANGLTTYFNHLQDVLHEDLIFDLEGLLNESFGENIRNLVAHGLYASGRFFMHPGFYTWWVALKLALHLERYLVTEQSESNVPPTAL